MEIAITKNKMELERLEGIIHKNLQSFYEVGKALMEIRDQGYYRDVLGYQTFEEYCRVKWDFTRRYAYLLMDSATVIKNVNNCSQIPATESQTRPLARLEPAQQKEAWQRAVDTAPNGKVTADHVYKIVKGMQEPEAQKRMETSRNEPSDAMQFATIAISQLERIHPKDPERERALRHVEEWIKKHIKRGRT